MKIEPEELQYLRLHNLSEKSEFYDGIWIVTDGPENWKQGSVQIQRNMTLKNTTN